MDMTQISTAESRRNHSLEILAQYHDMVKDPKMRGRKVRLTIKKDQLAVVVDSGILGKMVRGASVMINDDKGEVQRLLAKHWNEAVDCPIKTDERSQQIFAKAALGLEILSGSSEKKGVIFGEISGIINGAARHAKAQLLELGAGDSGLSQNASSLEDLTTDDWVAVDRSISPSPTVETALLPNVSAAAEAGSSLLVDETAATPPNVSASAEASSPPPTHSIVLPDVSDPKNQIPYPLLSLFGLPTFGNTEGTLRSFILDADRIDRTAKSFSAIDAHKDKASILARHGVSVEEFDILKGTVDFLDELTNDLDKYKKHFILSKSLDSSTRDAIFNCLCDKKPLPESLKESVRTKKKVAL